MYELGRGGYVFGGRRGAKVYRPNWICDDEGAL